MMKYMNMINKKGRRNQSRLGFTMTEMLIVVAIIIVLSGIVMINLPVWMRSTTQFERDGIAKELFVAAQNHLTMAHAEGYLGRDGEGRDDRYLKTEDDSSICYYVIGSDHAALDDVDSILGLMLPNASIDDSVRFGGSYVIRFHKPSGTVLDVFYAEPSVSKRYSHSFTEAEYDDLIASYRGKEHKSDRRKYGDDHSVIGYYGGVTADDLPESAARVAPPLVSVVNAERLIVTVNPNGIASADVRLVITGETSGAVKELSMSDCDSSTMSGIYTFVLDDITAEDGHFIDRFGDDGFIAGEDIGIKAVADVVVGSDERVIKSASHTVNSLFDELRGGNTAIISNIRHLENLGVNVSGFNGTVEDAVTAAEQTSDLSWKDFKTAIGDQECSIVLIDGSETEPGCFMPVTPYASVDYEGSEYSVSGITVNTSGSAGLFGTLNGGSVSDLVLVDFDIESTDSSAGALAGALVNVDLYGILVHNDTSSGEDDSALEITAANSAGGLVGLMNGGSVSACAAAVYVNAAENAGGLIGTASAVESVDSSYSGGHTVNARYQESTTGSGRINVRGGLRAGGLIGLVKGTSSTKTEISMSYTTSSVSTKAGGTAGGFIGRAEYAKLDTCYTTAFVANIGAAGTYLGSAGDVEFTGNHYYLTNLSPKVDNIFNDQVIGVSGKDAGRPDFIFVDGAEVNRRGAYIYDDALKVDYGGKYYFPTVEQLGGISYAGITDLHYGDWQVPYLDALGFRFVNEDRLYIEADATKLADKGTTLLLLSLTGENSSTEAVDNSIVYLIDVQDADNPNPVIKRQGTIIEQYDAGAGKMLRTIKWNGTTVKNPLPLSYDSETGRISVVLDDITKSGQHFAELFKDTPLIPGENIIARLAAGEISWSEMLEIEEGGDGWAKQNSLFALGNKGLDPKLSSGIETHTACIGYIRHLQNLDPVISKLNDCFDTAYLLNTIDWEAKADFYSKIYKADSAESVNGSFYGIYNPHLTLFDGRDQQLRGLVIKSAPESFSAVGAGNAALFRYVENMQFMVKNLDMCGASVAASAYAGTIVASAKGAEITLDTVLARHDAGVVASKYAVSGTTAGGLIGYVTNGSVMFDNSAASVLVTGTADAGGVLGSVGNGAATLSACYSGGHTSEGAFSVGASVSYNVTAANCAGGLIGSAFQSTVDIERSFAAASVRGVDGGGLVGNINQSNVTLDHVYAIAPVYGVSAKVTSDNHHGAVIGVIDSGSLDTGDTTYFLPELYTGNSDRSEMNDVITIGKGTYSGEAPGYAYYQKNEETNKISAKYYKNTMQIKTIPYDTSLGNNIFGSTREYPFSIWTSFPFTEGYVKPGGSEGYTLGTYYGDWQPIDTAETVERTITFSYINPIDGGVEIDLSAAVLGTQTLLQDEYNELLYPTVPYYPGYELKWVIEGKTEGTDYRTKNGMLIVEKSGATGNLHAKAVYTKTDDSVCSVSFFYNKDGMIGETYEEDGNTVTVPYSQIGSAKKVPYGTTWGEFMHPTDTDGNELPSPLKPRTINGYRFVGWCKDKDGTEVWADDEPIVNDEIVYAKYEKLEFFTVTIDFLYEIQQEGGESTTQAVTSIPRYSLDDVPQFRIVQPKGEAYNGKVTVPSVSMFDEDTTIRMIVASEEDKAHAWCIDGEGEKSYDLSVDPLTKEAVIYAEQDAHFQVIYQIPPEKSPVDVGMYRFVYVYKNTDPNSESRAFSATGERREYRFGSDKFFPMDIEGDGDPIVPSVSFETQENFKCVELITKEDSFKPCTDHVSVETVGEGDSKHKVYYYDLEIVYNRKKTKLYFDTSGGSAIEAIEMYIGEPLKSTVLDGKTTTREGYPTFSWGDPYKKGDPDKVSIGWNIPMPAHNVEVKASWVRENIPYTVIIWREKVTDDRDATDAEKEYDFVKSEVRTVKKIGDTATLTTTDKGYAGNGDYAGFHFNTSKSDTGNTVVKGDGSTVINAYYDRNMIYMVFDKEYSYTLTDKEIEQYKVSGGAKDADGHSLTYNTSNGQWEYEYTYPVTEYINKSYVGYDTFYATTTSNTNNPQQYAKDRTPLIVSGTTWYLDDGEASEPPTSVGRIYTPTTDSSYTTSTQYGSNGSQIYYKKSAWRTSNSNSGSVYSGTRYKTITQDTVSAGTTYYIVINGSMTEQTVPTGYQLVKYNNSYTQEKVRPKYTGTRYVVTTLANELAAGKTYTVFENGTMTTKTVPNGKVMRKDTDGKYYYYDIHTYNVTEMRPSEPVGKTKIYRGLYGQDITKYGYTWPKGNYQETHYYDSYDPATGRTSGDHGTGNTLTYLGQFVFLKPNYGCVMLTKSTGVNNKIYFVKQNEDGSYPPDYTKVPDVGNMATAGGSFNFSNKFDGYEVKWYTSSSSGTTDNWQKASDGGSGNTYAVRFERKTYDVTVYYGYITPADGIVFPAYGNSGSGTSSNVVKAYAVATDNTGTQYRDTGAQIYYRSSAWRTSDSSYGTKYNGTRYKELTANTYNAGTTYYVLEGGSMKAKTVPNGCQLVKKTGGYELVDPNKPNINPADFKKSTTARFDTPVTVNGSNLHTLSGDISVPSTLSISGFEGYTWNTVFYNDDKCTSAFEEGDEDRVPSAPKQYFVCYTPPYKTVTFELRTPEGASASASYEASDAPNYNELKCRTPYADKRKVQVLQGFSLDGWVTDDNGELLKAFTPTCEGYEFIDWRYMDGGVEKSFFSSMAIPDDITLYPHFEKLEVEHVAQNRIVHVYHIEEDTGDNILLETTDGEQEYEELLKECGTTADFYSMYFDEYYPLSSVHQQYISYYVEHPENPALDYLTITFKYKKVKTWNYSVEYRVQYRSYDNVAGAEALKDYTIEPMVMDDEELDSYRIGEILTQPAYSQYQSVVFTLPEGFGAYNLDRIIFERPDGSTPTVVDDNTYVVIDPGDKSKTFPKVKDSDPDIYAKVIFYIEPDPTAIEIGDRYEYYCGEEPAHYRVGVDAKTFAPPEGYDITVKDVYGFYDAEGVLFPKSKIINVGSYKMDGFILLEFKPVGASEPTKTYLLYKDITRMLNLRIQPRPVTITSASASRSYATLEPLVRSDPKTDITVTGPDDGHGGFIGKQGVDVFFSADAFRLDKGKSENAFTYIPYDGSEAGKEYTDPKNYQISVKFGTLEIK